MTTSRLATSRDLPVGDLIESGEWMPSTERVRNLPPTTSADPNPHHEGSTWWTLAKYWNETRKWELGACNLFRVSGKRIGRCMLPLHHDDFPGGSQEYDGVRHRIYLFSARDSAAILDAMRRRLEG